MKTPRILVGLAAIVLSGASLAAQGVAARVPPPNWPVPRYALYPAASAAEAGGGSFDKQGAELEKALPTAPSSFVGITPCRTVDTRGGGFSGPYGPPLLLAEVARNFVLTSRCGVPANAVALSLNLTIVAPTGDGFLAAFPSDSVPLVSTLNYRAGQVLANAAIVPLGSDGGITVFSSGASTHLLIDVNGYFTPQPTSQKLCNVTHQGSDTWTDTISVPASWTAAMCNDHRIRWAGSSGSKYQLGCVTDTGTSLGANDGGIPSPNCGW
jgi:hypothetical protein